jgi:hypothetical protein
LERKAYKEAREGSHTKEKEEEEGKEEEVRRRRRLEIEREDIIYIEILFSLFIWNVRFVCMCRNKKTSMYYF